MAENESIHIDENSRSLAQDLPTPEYLVPKMGDTGYREPVYYRSLFILDEIEPNADQETLSGPLNPFDENNLLKEQDLKPAFGVLTVHEQVWKQKGISLGNLLQSVCLAPGEVTQVAVTRWERKTEGTNTEKTEQSESVSDQSEQHRAVNEVQRAVAKEAQQGTSSAFSSSASAQVGASCFFGNASAASTTSTALTAQFSAGSRELAADSTNAISQSTAEKSQALRSRRQSVIREVTEQESETLSTRVLANYNRRHTMNILFFEVLQIYKFKTTLTSWDRCLFVPMIPLDFEDKDVIKTHQLGLLAIFSDFGATDMIEHLNRELDQQQKNGPDPASADYDVQVRDLQKARQIAQDYAEACKPVYQQVPARDAVWLNNGPDSYETVVVDNSKKQAEISAEYDVLKNKYANLPPITDAIGKIDAEINAMLVRKTQSKSPAGKIFNQHRLFLNQQLWLRLSPYQVYRMLQRYKIRDTTWGSATPTEQPISTLVDPTPVGVFGNYLAFRWGFPNTQEGRNARQKFEELHIKIQPKGIVRNVGLPTSGIFSEAVLGQSLAAEQIDGRFAKWSDKSNQIPILPPKIAALQSRDRARDVDLTAQDFSGSLAQLRAEKLADVSYIDKVLGQAGNGNMFRDMGGLAQAVSLADKLAALSTQGATKAGDRAVQLQTKVLEAFEKVMETEAGQAAVAEFMLPGAGSALLGSKGGSKKPGEAAAEKKPSEATSQ